MTRNKQVCVHQTSEEVLLLCSGWTSCAPILRFFCAASDGATAERQIQNRNFWSIFYQFEEQ